MNEINRIQEIYSGDKILSDIWDQLKELLNFKLETLSDVANLKAQLNKITTNYIREKYSWKPKHFIEAIEQELPTEYIKSEEWDTNKLFLEVWYAIILKRKIKIQLLISLLKNWLFDKILSSEEIDELINVFESRFLEYFDELFLKRYETINNENYSHEWWKIIFWWLDKNWQVVWLDQIHPLDTDSFKLLDDWLISEYIRRLMELIKKWPLEDSEFYTIEHLYLYTWRNDWTVWLIWSLENLQNEHFFSPEISLFIKQWLPEKQEIVDLSMEVFWESYWMDWIYLFFAEDLINVWDSWFTRIWWRNFPNEVESKEKYWTYIYCIESNVILWHLSYKQILDRLANFDTKRYEQQIWELLIEEVKYHEFWHNLFNNWYNSDFEETKATFYYFLYLSENKDKINTIPLILSILSRMLRNFIRKKQTKFNQYLITYRLIFQCFLKYWIIIINWENVEIDFDKNKLWLAIDELAEYLFIIKLIFENKEKEREEKLIQDLVSSTESQIELLINFLNKN